MKKTYLCLSILLGIAISNNVKAQTFDELASTPTGDDYNYVVNNSDTLRFTFATLPTGAYTDGVLKIEFNAYVETGAYYQVFAPNLDSIGVFGVVYDCNDFINQITIPFASINSYGGSGVFKVVKKGVNNIYPYCNTNRIRFSLKYGYCPTGVPTQFADFTVTDNMMCPTDGPKALVGSPTGGVFTGVGVSGNAFNATGLQPNNYELVYTFTDANGCYTSDTSFIVISRKNDDLAITACEKTNPVVDFEGKYHVYSSNLSLSPIIDTAALATFPNLLVSPTSYYSANIVSNFYYSFDTLTIADSLVVDHDALTGDDRSGIAITDSTIYIVGDNATAMFDLDLQNGVQIDVVADGIFTDLSQRKIYTLYNTTTNSTPDGNNGFEVNAIAELNANLTVGSVIIPLSQTVSIGFSDYAMILAGYNQLILGTNGSGDFYNIDIASGNVTSLGVHSFNTNGSENWADWGMSGFDGVDFHAYYRSNSGPIVDYNFTTLIEVNVSDFTDYNDMACFIVHPINNRLYFHYEGSNGTFGGSSETLGYTSAQDSVSNVPSSFGSIGCPNTITFTFNSIDLGADTTVCSEDGVYILEGGFGFNAYSWNGDNSNYNIYPAQDSGQVILEVLDEVNCTLTDTVVVDFNQCTAGVNELTNADLNIYPVPNSGTFTVSFLAPTSASLLMVVDAQGKVVSQQTVAKGETSVSLQTKVEPGIYFVKIVSETGTIQRPIIVQ